MPLVQGWCAGGLGRLGTVCSFLFPLSLQLATKLLKLVVSGLGLEPRTNALKGRCSTS